MTTVTAESMVSISHLPMAVFAVAVMLRVITAVVRGHIAAGLSAVVIGGLALVAVNSNVVAVATGMSGDAGRLPAVPGVALAVIAGLVAVVAAVGLAVYASAGVRARRAVAQAAASALREAEPATAFDASRAAELIVVEGLTAADALARAVAERDRVAARLSLPERTR